MNNSFFGVDDKVSYTGSKFASEIGNKPGWVVAPVTNQKNTFVVEFGDDSFVMSSAVLVHRRDQLKEQDPNSIGGVEVRRSRRRASDDD